jgi:heat shock protein HslJ
MGTFKGLVYIKYGGIGTKSEGPHYYIQTFNKEHLLKYANKDPYELDYYLEFFCRKFVDVTGEYDKETNTINVKRIDEICVEIVPQNITNIEWQWAGFQKSSNSENKTIVPDPENYTLAFFPDGTYYIKADCNRGSGNYTLEGDSLNLDPAEITRMMCGPDSMDREYLALLSDVESATIKDEQLFLDTNKSNTMFFKSGGETEQ